MAFKGKILSIFNKLALINHAIDWEQRKQESNVNIVLESLFREANKSHNIISPVIFVEFLRGCFKPLKFNIKKVKGFDDGAKDTAINRFNALLHALEHFVPPISSQNALSAALTADVILAETGRMDYDTLSIDVASHFKDSSSFGSKGRLLAAIVKMMDTGRCLELGTAYGMSALFILQQMNLIYSPDSIKPPWLVTVELGNIQYEIASKMLQERFANNVACHKGYIQEVMPEVLREYNEIDFMFHDAGHTKEDYINDFKLIEPNLSPGATVLIDDINWFDPRFVDDPKSTYEGWREVVNHARVRAAVELDGMGLLLVK